MAAERSAASPSRRGAGRFVLLHCAHQDGMAEPEWGYVTSWDTWEEAGAAFPIAPGFKLHDDETGREWLANSEPPEPLTVNALKESLEMHEPRLPAQRRAAALAERVATRPDPPFTNPDPTPLEMGMDTNSDIEEAAFFDLLEAREAAIQGATGALAMLNVPTERLLIVAKSTDNILSLAARIVLYQRGVKP